MKSRIAAWLMLAAIVLVALIAAAGWLLLAPPGSQPGTGQETATSEQQRNIAHAQGNTAVPLHPSRVAVFDLSALDTLDALGVDVVGVAGHEFPSYLRRYADDKYLNLGTLFEPDFEAVNAARPDLIITGGRSSAKYAPLSRMAPAIDMPSDNAHPIQTALDNARLLSTIFGREAQAEVLVAQITEAVATLRAKTADRGRGLIVLVSGGKLSAYGPGSRFGVLHTDFGIPPAAPDLAISLHGEAIGSEFILKTNPDWLFVIDRDVAIGEAGAARQVLDNPLVRRTNAWKHGQVLYLDAANWYLVGEGIQALRAMIEQIDRGYELAR